MLSLGLATLALVASSSAAKTVLGYYTNWAQYRSGVGKFLPENVDPTILTHAAYAFAMLDETTYEVVPFEWNDEDTDWSKGMYTRFHEHIAAHNPGVKTVLSLGGWTFSQEKTVFNQMAASATNRKAFIDSSIAFARRTNFDGIDMDWEYPKLADKANFNTLMFEMRDAYEQEAAATGNPRLILSAAVSANIVTWSNSYDGAFGAACDWVGLMAYDLYGAWETEARNHAQLHPLVPSDPEEQAVARGVELWLQTVSNDRFVMGLATYGRAMYVADPTEVTSHPCNQAVVSTGAAGPSGPTTREPGFYAYYEIMSAIAQGGHLCEDLEVTMGAVMTKDNIWIGFDTVNTLAAKVAYGNSKNLQGYMFWALDLDDFNNGYPLVSSVYQAVNGGYVPPPPPPPATTSAAPPPTTQAPEPTTSAAPPPTTEAPPPTTEAPPPETTSTPAATTSSSSGKCVAISAQVTDAWCEGVNCDPVYAEFCTRV